MSPDGLGGGLYSSVFMDTGVEGLIQAPPDHRSLRETRQHVVSPQPSSLDLAGDADAAAGRGAGRRGAPAGGAADPRTRREPAPPGAAEPLLLRERFEGLRVELGSGEGVTSLLERSSTAGEGERARCACFAQLPGPGWAPPPGKLLKVQALMCAAGGGPGVVHSGGETPPGGASPAFSPPSSPRRRQTTFGATLDFIEALCTASSGLTAFQGEVAGWQLAGRWNPSHCWDFCGGQMGGRGVPGCPPSRLGQRPVRPLTPFFHLTRSAVNTPGNALALPQPKTGSGRCGGRCRASTRRWPRRRAAASPSGSPWGAATSRSCAWPTARATCSTPGSARPSRSTWRS